MTNTYGETTNLINTGEIILSEAVRISRNPDDFDCDYANRFAFVQTTHTDFKYIDFIFIPTIWGAPCFSELIRGQWNVLAAKWQPIDWFEKHDVSGLLFAYALGLLEREG